VVQCIQMAKYDAEREILPRKDSDRILVQKGCSCSWFSIQIAFVAGGSEGASKKEACAHEDPYPYYSAQGSDHQGAPRIRGKFSATHILHYSANPHQITAE
jgi:hypothetical protein